MEPAGRRFGTGTEAVTKCPAIARPASLAFGRQNFVAAPARTRYGKRPLERTVGRAFVNDVNEPSTAHIGSYQVVASAKAMGAKPHRIDNSVHKAQAMP